MLGKVAKWLRILGYDTLYFRLTSEQQIQEWVDQGRLVVSRNRKWLPGGRIVFLDDNEPVAQMQQLIAQLHLGCSRDRIFTRCIRCNRGLQPIPRSQAEGEVPDAVWLRGYRFHRCPDCSRIYWPGTHPEKMLGRLKRLWGNRIDETN